MSALGYGKKPAVIGIETHDLHRMILLIFILACFRVAVAQEVNLLPNMKTNSQTGDSLSVVLIENGWKFEAELFKQTVVYCEPVYLRRKLTNISSESRPRPRMALQLPDCSMKLYNSQGEEMSMLIARASLSGRKGLPRMLQPGDNVLAKEINLLWWAAMMDEESYIFAYPPDDYTLEFSLYTDPLQKAPRDENTLVLPPLRFRIIEPTGDDAEAYEIFRRGMSLRWENPARALQCLDSVLTIFPDTPYDELAIIELIQYRSMGKGVNRSELVRWREKYLLKYPHTPFRAIVINIFRLGLKKSRLL